MRKVILLVACVLLAACSSDSTEDARLAVVPGRLTQADLVFLRERALLGNAMAANRLAFYYALEHKDEAEQYRWWIVAAENGDRGAMRALAVSMPKRNSDDCLRSIFWLSRAAGLYPRWHEEYEDVQAEYVRAKQELSVCEQRVPPSITH